MYQIVIFQGCPDDPMGPIAFQEVSEPVFLRKHIHVPNSDFPGGSRPLLSLWIGPSKGLPLQMCITRQKPPREQTKMS